MLRLLGVLAMLALTAPALTAQDKKDKSPVGEASVGPLRQGFGGAVGLAAGSQQIECDGCDVDARSGLSGSLVLGGYVNPQLFLGFEGIAWAGEDTDIDETLTYLTGVAHWYASARSNLFVKANVGIARYSGLDSSGEIVISAPVVGLGLGYDLRLGQSLAMTPFVQVLATTEGPVEFDGTELDFKASVRLLQFGAAITWF